MRSAYGVETVRAAEQPLLDGLPEGALMARAAAGLTRVCALMLDGVYGSRVLLLVGAATTAATRSSPAPHWPGAAPGSTRC